MLYYVILILSSVWRTKNTNKLQLEKLIRKQLERKKKKVNHWIMNRTTRLLNESILHKKKVYDKQRWAENYLKKTHWN